MVKNPPVKAGDSRDVGSIPWEGSLKIPRKWQPTPAFFPGESHGQRSLWTEELQSTGSNRVGMTEAT